MTEPAPGIARLIRPELAAFGGYSAATSPDTLQDKIELTREQIVKLDANENPYGCSPRVQKALASYEYFNTYPDDGQAELRKMFAGYAGVDAKYIVAGSGSNQLIDLVLRLLLNKGDEVINCVPTFGIYRFSTALCGGTLVEIKRDGDFAVDVAAVKAAITRRTKIICLVNPNNPSGNLIPRADIEALLRTDMPVLVDEAYYEFSGETVAPLVPKNRNLMVLRTLSKWAGLAGLRVGYGLFPPEIARYLLTIKIPYNVNVAAIEAVKESLKDFDYLMASVKKIVAEKDRLFTRLEGISWLKPVPSQANFILCRVEKGEAKDLWQKLQDRGILVRYFSEPALKNYIRISAGKPEHTDTLIKALQEIGG